MSFDLIDRFDELYVSTPKIAPLNRKKLNISYNNNEYNLFDYYKRSSRILLNHKDLTLFGLKAGSIVKLQHQNILIQNLFEVWPSVFTKPNDVTFGVTNLKTWLDIEIDGKVDLFPVSIDKKPVETANKIQVRYYNSNIPKITEHILRWIKTNNIFGESCRNFVTIGNEDIFFLINVIDSSKSTLYRFDSNKTVIEEVYPSPKLSNAKFGGLQNQFDEMVKLAEAFLKPRISFIAPELKLSHGILLYGPPGCGKTLLVRKVSDFINVPVVHLTASDLHGSGYGEAEKKMLEIFESAKKLSPSIIFMDEIDSLCPKRDSNTSASSLRITTLLLSLMDGCYDSTKESKVKVLFIGATNISNSLDPALRRPGRFDREIEICPPSSQDRFAILRNILDNYPSNITLSDLKNISDASHGYVGSDLNLLCKEAFIIATKKLDDLSKYAEISITDMEMASSKIRPSAMREVFIEVPKVKWSDIGGQKITKQKLIESVEWPIKYPERFEKLGIKPPKGILLFGPPGCSKTLLAKALASESGLNFLAVKGPEIFSKYIGESEKKIREIFKKARQSSPSIIFFDEFDSIAGRSDSEAGMTAVSDRVISQLLNEMDGLEPLINVIIIAATNKPDLIDKALLRPGRFDRHIYISPPDFEGRLEILQILLKRMPFSKEILPETLADLTENFSGAEIVSLCQNSAIKCLERDITNLEIEWEDIKFCFGNFERQINPELLKVYEKFIK